MRNDDVRKGWEVGKFLTRWSYSAHCSRVLVGEKSASLTVGSTGLTRLIFRFRIMSSAKATGPSTQAADATATSQPPRGPRTKAAKAASSSAAADATGEAPSETQWWERNDIDASVFKRGEKKWSTLEHNGPLFAEPYVPHGVPIKYEGRTLPLNAEEEEVATFFGCMKNSDYYRNPIFRKNFFAGFKAILDKRKEAHPVRNLDLIEFDDIFDWFTKEKEKRLTVPSEEKKRRKAELDAKVAKYQYCMWDGRKEQVANFRIEPPGLFRGRGKHPLQGCIKKRIHPEDVVINISEGVPVPDPGPGHHWKQVQHDHTVTWLCMFRDSVTDQFKYVMMAPNSSIKGITDREKFEKARRLKLHIDRIRQSYQADFASSNSDALQRAVAMYFIDKLALRVGNEKGEDEADTVGCCSLRVEHVTPVPDNRLRFDFLGKDSIRYENEVTVDPRVYKLVVKFRQGKSPTEDLFTNLDPTALNDHLKSFMDGLSAKVFRTYNASVCLEQQLNDPATKALPHDATVDEKLVIFNRANTQVAILCNHQKSVNKNFESQMGVMKLKLNELKDFQERLGKIKELEDEHGEEQARKFFFEEEDRIQWAWLTAHGTDEEKAEYAALVKSRETTGVMGKRAKTSAETAAKAAKLVKKAAKTAKRATGIASAGKKKKKNGQVAKKVATRSSSASAGTKKKKKTTTSDQPEEQEEHADEEDDAGAEETSSSSGDEEENSSDGSSSSSSDDDDSASSSSSSDSDADKDLASLVAAARKGKGGAAKPATATKKGSSPTRRSTSPSPKKAAPPKKGAAAAKKAPSPPAKTSGKKRAPSPPSAKPAVKRVPSPPSAKPAGKRAPSPPSAKPAGKGAPSRLAKPAAAKKRAPSPPPAPAKKGAKKTARDPSPAQEETAAKKPRKR